MEKATKDSWKIAPHPKQKESLGYKAFFTDAEADVLMQGFVPQQMEDKWFIYFQDGWLYFHRSSSGCRTYWVKLDGSPAGVRVTASYVNRDPEQYTQTDIEQDRKMLDYLIRTLLLNQEMDFPFD